MLIRFIRVSHYRREHAPLRKYLPSDITITQMHKYFIEKHNNVDCSYYTYRAFVRDRMKISFAKLGHEECEQCEVFGQHDLTHTKNSLDLDKCDICKKWNAHIKKATEARKKYREDGESTTEWTPMKICVSADLQKVIMLPRIDTFKQVLFTQRIIAFNESFVAVGKHQQTLGPSAVIWHKGLAGRKKEELCSAFHKYLLSQRDVLSIKIWLDNCAAQNKNWTLFSFLAHIINSSDIAANVLEIYFFEPGYSFMSADSFHHQVEQSMNSYGSSLNTGAGGKIYDFNDFQGAIEQVKMKNVKVLSMELSDFRDWKDHSSLMKIKKYSPRPYLSDIVKLKFERGSFSLWYSNEYNSHYTEVNFLTAKYLKNLTEPNVRSQSQSVTKSRKADIIKKLCPLMPENRRHFWEELPVSNEATNLSQDID
ncbi:uncharacterized protein LOC126743745 [Anthonomus grandis grandis]|uniref:uncharacterized protein LOC126743745 n=1 Tax=Anthonomus grandis grandis TaxID=2921223 RepID=UPI00216633CB|nr:uncharacterized protein LOC126743745 [Anthonomus grandis grandis]